MSTNFYKTIKSIVTGSLFAKANGRNIVGVGIGTKRIGGYDTGIECVSVYVASKAKDPDELAPNQIVSAAIAGVPTDVVEVGRIFAARTNVVRASQWAALAAGGSTPLPQPGSSIGPLVADLPNVNQVLSGTLGAVLQSGSKWYVLSANHVLSVNGRLGPDTRIFSPSPEDNPNLTIGPGPEVAEAPLPVPLRRTSNGGPANRVDCAIAELVGAVPRVNPAFPDRRQVTTAVDPVRGMKVVKYGKTTGFTTGTIVDVQADILVDYSFGTFAFTDQILIRSDDDSVPFAADGDSGSVILNAESNEAVGLLYAPVGQLTAACPMPVVLTALTEQLRSTPSNENAPPLLFAAA